MPKSSNCNVAVLKGKRMIANSRKPESNRRDEKCYLVTDKKLCKLGGFIGYEI